MSNNSLVYVILDNGHGINTPGKRSPLMEDNHVFYEWEYNRKMVKRLSEMIDSRRHQLLNEGIDLRYMILVPESTDISLNERVMRANNFAKGKTNVILVSCHCNAAGDAKNWNTATGWEVFTTIGETNSDKLAEHMVVAAKNILKDKKLRLDYSDGDGDKESNFFILKKTNVPSVLVENFFMTNKDDVKFLESEDGLNRCCEVIYQGIVNYAKNNIK